MDFTREPIIETIITPKEGAKLVVRSSKGVVQEEYFCDAVQIVSYGNALFYRSIERPKAFLVPVTDYEILEVREARMVLKNASVERTIKIGGGREGGNRERERAPREQTGGDRQANANGASTGAEGEERKPAAAGEPRPQTEGRPDKKRERRRQGRRRRGPDDAAATGDAGAPQVGAEAMGDESGAAPAERRDQPTPLSSILPPPSQLISETLQQYRSNDLFKDIFSRTTETEQAETVIAPVPVAAELPKDDEEETPGIF